jgi:uncharacterized protein YjbJ (UPF0337 family)
MKGKIKETAGKVTNNPNLQAEGSAEKNTGKVEKKVGQIEKWSKSKLGGLKRSEQPMYCRSPLSTAETGEHQLGARSSVLKRADNISPRPNPLSHDPGLLSPLDA